MTASIRIDKWLWHSRLVKTRSLAGRLCEAGLVELGSTICRKPAHPIRIGDTLQLSHGGWRRTVEILDLGDRRGPAAEARGLYAELAVLRPSRTDPDWTPLLSDTNDGDIEDD